MAKFITNNGSYTLVLKPEGARPIYDHTGKPVRVEGTIFAEFKNIRGTAVGVLETEDEELIGRLRKNINFGKSFKEVMDDSEIRQATAAATAPAMVRLPKAALMACNKNELTSLAAQYKLQLGEDMTKAEIVEMIMNSQASQPEQAPAQVPEQQGGIRKIIQQPQN